MLDFVCFRRNDFFLRGDLNQGHILLITPTRRVYLNILFLIQILNSLSLFDDLYDTMSPQTS